MKIIQGTLTKLSHEVRGFWHITQDLVCLTACVLASSSAFPYYTRANNLFIFFTCITFLAFLYKIFRTDLYKKSVMRLGAWGSKYRCFYAVYYPTIAFLCASLGGFKGYAFALIWILSGGTYLVIADGIAKEENKKIEEAGEKIAEKIADAETGCPYCQSNKYKEEYSKEINKLRIKNTCKKCDKIWHQVYNYVDVELKSEDIMHSNEIQADEIFG